MSRYSGRQQVGYTTTPPSSSGGFLSSITSQLVSRQKLRAQAAPKPVVFHGTTSGQKKLISQATGKGFAQEAVFENLKRINLAIKKGHTTFIDFKTRQVRDIGTIDANQRYMALHWADQGEVKTREGNQQLNRGFIKTAHDQDIKLREGLNTGSTYEDAAKMEKATRPKPVDEILLRKQALARLHERLTAAAPAMAPAKSSAPGVHTPTMTFQSVEPIGSGMIGTPVTHTFGTTLTGGSSIVMGGIGTPSDLTQHTDAPNLQPVEPAGPPSLNTVEPVTPATAPPAPTAPEYPPSPSPGSMGDAFGGSGE